MALRRKIAHDHNRIFHSASGDNYCPYAFFTEDIYKYTALNNKNRHSHLSYNFFIFAIAEIRLIFLRLDVKRNAGFVFI